MKVFKIFEMMRLIVAIALAGLGSYRLYQGETKDATLFLVVAFVFALTYTFSRRQRIAMEKKKAQENSKTE